MFHDELPFSGVSQPFNQIQISSFLKTVSISTSQILLSSLIFQQTVRWPGSMV